MVSICSKNPRPTNVQQIDWRRGSLYDGPGGVRNSQIPIPMDKHTEPIIKMAGQDLANSFLAFSGKAFLHQFRGLLIRVEAAQTTGVKKTMATPPPTKKSNIARIKNTIGPFFLWIKPIVHMAKDKATMIAAMPVKM